LADPQDLKERLDAARSKEEGKVVVRDLTLAEARRGRAILLEIFQGTRRKGEGLMAETERLLVDKLAREALGEFEFSG